MNNWKCLVIFCTIFVFFNTTMAQLPRKPNILYIMADDMGYQDVGFRDSDILTPNIDKLATDGVILENHYVMPMCSPTRASLMSGRYAIRTGFWKGNIKPSEQWGLKLNETTMAEMLKRNGYTTHGIGKWHCGMYSWEHTPAKRGFDTFFGMYLGSQDYFSHKRLDSLDLRYDYHNETGDFVDEIRDDLTHEYNTRLFTERAKSVIKNHDGKIPLFMYLAYTAPHTPRQVPEESLERYTRHMKNTSHIRKIYGAMISEMDAGIGQIVEYLEKYGLRDNTIIVFSSDNGAVCKNTTVFSNYPLRGGKFSLYEGGVRAISFVNSPLLEKKGYVNTNLHHVVDWYKTFQELVGDTPGSKPQLPTDGVNIWGSISRNETLPRDEVLINMRSSARLNYGIGQHKDADCLGSDTFLIDGPEDEILGQETDDYFVLRWKKWKFFVGEFQKQGWSGLNNMDEFKLHKNTLLPKTKIQLFDVTSDTREENNVAADNPEIVKLLSAKIHAYLEKMVFIGIRSIDYHGKKNGVWMPLK